MDYDLKTPCANCPFRKDVKGYLRGDRVREIVTGLARGAEFACHKTTVDTDDEEGGRKETAHSKHCAGALIFMEKIGVSSQMLRINERLGLGPKDLKNRGCVFKSVDAMVTHHEPKKKLRGLTVMEIPSKIYLAIKDTLLKAIAKKKEMTFSEIQELVRKEHEINIRLDEVEVLVTDCEMPYNTADAVGGHALSRALGEWTAETR